jgi:hypothetical protein
MTLEKMQSCAAETLSFFMRTLPDIPFAEDDIVFEFVPRQKMVERARELFAQYRPEDSINETKAWELENIIAANAIIGRERSAVLIRIDSRKTKQEWRDLIYHELMHIFCAKSEMDEEHFIDIYGSGHTPDENPDNKAYDGTLNAGYVIWSEFIAQYYALVKAGPQRFTSARINMQTIAENLIAVNESTSLQSCKTCFAMACSYLLACSDAEKLLSRIDSPDFIWIDNAPCGQETRTSFLACAQLLYEHLQNEKPWKITEQFIGELGTGFLMFKMMNSLYMARHEEAWDA